jgi:hypothetical protein
MGQGGDGVSLAENKALKMSNITTHQAPRHHLHDAHQIQGNCSLLNWLILGMREVWPNDVCAKTSTPMEKIAEAQDVLQELNR